VDARVVFSLIMLQIKPCNDEKYINTNRDIRDTMEDSGKLKQFYTPFLKQQNEM